MKWQKTSPYLATSDTRHQVAMYIVHGKPVYRASHGGKFIGNPTSDPQEAKRACESHAGVVTKQPG